MSKKDIFDIKKEIEDLRTMVEDLKKNQKSHCSECGRPYIEPVYPYPVPNPYPVPYIPGTPIGPYWTWPITITTGTISNDLDNGVNTFPPNWINGDGGSTI